MTQGNTMNTGHTVVAVFDDVANAERAINDLKVSGFTPESISVVTKDRTTQRDLNEATGNQAGQGALVGSLGGGTLGAVIGWLLAGGTALIPGIGPVVAAGIFGATVGGALIGGTLGGITGALAGAGVPEEEAGEYEEHVRSGRTLLTVSAANGQLLEAAMDVFNRNGATNVRYYDLNTPGPGQNYQGQVTDAVNTNSDYMTVNGPGADAARYTRENETRTTPVMDEYDSQVNRATTYDTPVERREYVDRDTSNPSRTEYTTRDADSTLAGDYNAGDRTRGTTLGDERLGSDDISTLPDNGRGTTTRGGAGWDRPAREGMPGVDQAPLDENPYRRGDSDLNNPPPRSM
ncbi:MAG TPA: general stress protein [Chloroflexia bacterium]|nr:general stress protein [Chloroflexia bacterium]